MVLTRLRSTQELESLVIYARESQLSLGLPDNKLNRKVAEAKAKLIEADIARYLNNFDSQNKI